MGLGDDTNEVRVSGRLARDPEHYLRETLDVCDLLVECRQVRTHQGELVQKVFHIHVKAVGATARLCCQALRKGAEVTIRGELDSFEYRTPQGSSNRVGVVAHEVNGG